MIEYVPGGTIAHRLDPRAKLAFQFGFAIAAFGAGMLWELAATFAVGVLALAVARLSPIRALRAYWVVLILLVLGPLGAGLRLGPPWFAVDAAVSSLWSVARVVPVLLVSAAYVHSTPARDTRAAIQRTVPGRLGALLGLGVGLTFRFVPLVRADVTRIREAIAARGGESRSVRDRAGRLAILSVSRAFARADALGVALRARCLAYNPTLPSLAFTRADWLLLAVSLAFALSILY
ncbi:MAG: energy-coupling factor transporter transmembrane protein EcfT [Salinirussus sp.]